MKKILVSLGAICLFALYSLGVRHQLPVVAKSDSNPASTTSSNPNTSANQTTNPTTTLGQYKDGTYTGSQADAFYGNVQVRAVVSGGKLSDVSFLSYPTDHQDSVLINQQATPMLKQEAIQAQGAKVQIVTGATFTSQAFEQSLAAALSQAKA